MVDWGDGRYEDTAGELLPVSERAVERAAIVANERVLDLGCGTGNAALLAARRGADVTGVDPAARLLEVARERVAAEGLHARFVGASAASLPFEPSSFDVALSVFAVIFAPDAEAAVAELARVVRRPGGRVVLTSWLPAGAIAEADMLVGEAVATTTTATLAAWDDPAFVRSVFEAHGASVELSTETISFAADSAEDWFEQQRARHPVWRKAYATIAPHPGSWEALRARALDLLNAGNEDTTRFRATSRYLLVRAAW